MAERSAYSPYVLEGLFCELRLKAIRTVLMGLTGNHAEREQRLDRALSWPTAQSKAYYHAFSDCPLGSFIQNLRHSPFPEPQQLEPPVVGLGEPLVTAWYGCFGPCQ
jgi:hypothetical protein